VTAVTDALIDKGDDRRCPLRPRQNGGRACQQRWETIMRTLMHALAAAALAAGVVVAALPAAAQTYYTINGQPAPDDVQLYMAQNGLPAGDYWLDAQGYWGVMGNPNPWGNIYSGSYVSRYGSGEQGSNGWSHYDNMSGTWVGGDSNGCYYTAEWSNC
jgi:hypothetical protein